MTRIVIFGEKSSFPKSVQKNSEVSFLSHSSLLSWELDEIQIPNGVSMHSLYLEEINILINKFRAILPVFVRNFDDLTGIELHFRALACQTVALANVFHKNNVQILFQTTSVSHWVESFMIEYACELNKIHQIFPYATIFEGRILPLTQLKGIHTREILGMEVSNYNFDYLLSDGDGLRTLGKSMAPTGFSTQNLQAAVILAFLFFFKKNFKSIYRTMIRKPQQNEVFKLNSIGLRKTIELLKRHDDSIGTLRKLIKKDSASAKLLATEAEQIPHLVIYGHFQPEATTFPEGGDFSDHIELVADVRSQGFQGELFFKEHPAMFKLSGKYSNNCGVARSPSYYRTLQGLGVTFIDPAVTIEAPHMAITIAGSIALERAMQGDSTVVYGKPWFKNMPGCITFHDFCESEHPWDFLNSDELRIRAKFYLAATLNGKTLPNLSGLAGYKPSSSSLQNENLWGSFFEKILLHKFKVDE